MGPGFFESMGPGFESMGPGFELNQWDPALSLIFLFRNSSFIFPESFFLAVIIYCHDVTEAVRVTLSSPSFLREKISPPPGFKLGSPRPRTNELDRLAMETAPEENLSQYLSDGAPRS